MYRYNSSLPVLCLLFIFILFYLFRDQTDAVQRKSTSEGPHIAQSSKQQKRFPDAVIIGVKKSGTSFLKSIFRMHPNIAIAQHEVHFFDRKFNGNYDDYLQYLPSPENGQIVMEKTPKYWIWPKVPEMLYDINPNMKLILTLRDPACRTISDFFHSKMCHEIKSKDLNATFRDAKYLKSANFILTPSMYDEHLDRWLKVFPRNQIMILKNENLCTSKMKDILFKIESFLKIPHHFNVSIGEKICVETDRKTTCFNMCSFDYECKYKEIYPDIYKLIKDKLNTNTEYLGMFDDF